MNNAIIVGAGNHGEVYKDYLSPYYEITGFVDDNPKLFGKKILGVPVLGDLEYLFSSVEKDVCVFVPLGNNALRVKILQRLQTEGFSTPGFIHPAVKDNIPESVTIGRAVYILPGFNVMPFVSIGDYCMFSSGVNVSHHTKIANGCFFSYGTNIGAFVDIKEQSYVGAGATVMTGVKQLGINSLIGAGAVVIRDVPDNAVVAGVPAKVLKYK